MSNKINLTEATGQNIYVFLWDEDDQICYPTGETFETYGTNGRTASDYAISLSEVVSGLGYYTGTWPSFVERGTYYLYHRLQAGASPADSDYNLGSPVEVYWTGTTTAAEPETNAVNICNKALAKMGGGRDNATTITALGDGTDTSDNCDLIYTSVRREVLKRMKPQECTYYAECEESSFSGEKADWEYVFDLPSNYLDMIKQCDEGDHTIEYAYEIIQGYLVSNNYSNTGGDKAYIKYIKNETDASVFSDEVVEAITTKLAAELAPLEIGGEWSWKRRQDLLEEYETLVLSKSMGINRAAQYNDESINADKYSWLGGRS